MLYAEASDATLYSADKMDSTSVERADIFWISCWDIYTRDVYYAFHNFFVSLLYDKSIFISFVCG